MLKNGIITYLYYVTIMCSFLIYIKIISYAPSITLTLNFLSCRCSPEKLSKFPIHFGERRHIAWFTFIFFSHSGGRATCTVTISFICEIMYFNCKYKPMLPIIALFYFCQETPYYVGVPHNYLILKEKKIRTREI